MNITASLGASKGGDPALKSAVRELGTWRLQRNLSFWRKKHLTAKRQNVRLNTQKETGLFPNGCINRLNTHMPRENRISVG